MSDLISRQTLINAFEENNLFLPEVVEKLINELPIAYDVDKVVEQLENIKKCGGMEALVYNQGVCDAIEIVKGGGVDDKC